MERVHAHEVDGRKIKGESACSALAKLKDSGIGPKILNFFPHGHCIFLHNLRTRFIRAMFWLGVKKKTKKERIKQRFNLYVTT